MLEIIPVSQAPSAGPLVTCFLVPVVDRPDSSTTTLEGRQMWLYESEGGPKSVASPFEIMEFRIQPFKRITLEEAFASALRHLEEAEERRRKADALEAEFVAKLLDFEDEEA